MPDEIVNAKLVVTDKIGIGVDDPIAQLHISSTDAPSQAFLESGGVLLKLSVDASGASIGTNNAFPLSIQTDGTSRISINSTGSVDISAPLSVQNTLTISGNVGIGTTASNYKLAIAAGDINIDDSRALKQAGRWVIGGNSNVLSIGSADAPDGRDIRFDPGFAGALTIKKDTGNVGIGTTNPKAKLDVAGNINISGIISGASLPPNLIRNSYMNILDGTKPAGYSVLGNVTLEAAHPYTKGFEGPYVPERPPNAASSIDTATQANPYWFGVYYKGLRVSRGGLADGWCSFPDGKLLKITGNNSVPGQTSVCFPFEPNVLTNKVHFKAWLKITSGAKVGFGVDAGYYPNSPMGWGGLVLTKEQTDAAPDGWYQIDAVINISEVTNLGWMAFSMGIEASGIFEVYLALPYLANLDNDTWLPSVSDMLSRDGLTVHPSSRNVGIGTIDPRYPLHLAGGAYCTGTQWKDGSSREYKEDVAPLTLDKALETLAELSPVTFKYKVEADQKHVGFIAEEVPELVASKDRKGLSPMDIVGILTKVVQHQQKEIEQFKADREKNLHLGFIAEDAPDLVTSHDRKAFRTNDIVAVLTKVVKEQQKTISGLVQKVKALENQT